MKRSIIILSLLILPITGNAQGKVKGLKNLATPEPSRLEVIKSSLHRIPLKPCGSASPVPSPTALPSDIIRTNEVN